MSTLGAHLEPARYRDDHVRHAPLDQHVGPNAGMEAGPRTDHQTGPAPGGRLQTAPGPTPAEPDPSPGDHPQRRRAGKRERRTGPVGSAVFALAGLL